MWRVRGPQGEERALKVLLAPTESQRRRFALEARVLRRLDHPNLVQVLDAGQETGRDWLVMELVEGGSLEQRLRDGPLDPAEAARLARDLALALAHAHAQGVLHRDVKPSNVLLDREGRPRLTDFGLARDLTSEAERLSLSGNMLGTPGYWAPEQAAGLRDQIGPATDVYGLGATLYATLTGHPPYEARSLHEHLQLIEGAAPVPPSRHRPGLDPELERICLRCLRRSPAERFPGAADLARALDERLGRRSRPAPRRVARLPAAFVLAGAAGAGVVALLSLGQPADPPTAPAPLPQLRDLRLEPGPLLGKDTIVTEWPLADDDNYGASGWLAIGHRVLRGQAYAHESLLAWDLSVLPAGVALERAVLSLHGNHRWPLVIGAQPLDGSEWVEGTSLVDAVVDGVTWRDRPGGAPWCAELELPVAAEVVSPHPGRHDLDITPVVSACLVRGLGRCDLRLRPLGSIPTAEGNWTSVFSSSDGVERPRLTLTWRGDPPRPLPDESALEREAEARALVLLDQLPEAPRTRLVRASQALALAPHSQRVILARCRAAWALRLAEGPEGSAGDAGMVARADLARALPLGPEAHATAMELLEGHLTHVIPRTTFGFLSDLLQELERSHRPSAVPSQVLAALEALPLDGGGDLIRLHAQVSRCWGPEAAAVQRERVRQALLAAEPAAPRERSQLLALLVLWGEHWPDPEVERRARQLGSE